MMSAMHSCHACKRTLEIGKSIGRRDECPFCGADLHSCLNCLFYDGMAPKKCKEPVAERVSEKAKANFCNYFVYAKSRDAGSSDTAVEQTRKALDELFNK